MGEHFKVDLRGIIDLAANHLYTSPDVFVRELIQNAADAVTARAGLDQAPKGMIRLELVDAEGEEPGTIVVSDNGIGLTMEEVHSFLSTVGGSSKRGEAEDVAEQIRGDSGGFLGRFGIGLLSCFMVTDEVVVVTRSARDAHAPVIEWRGRSDGGYQVRELSISAEPGTTVYVKGKPGAEDYFVRARLIELAKRYAEFLPFEIVVATGSGDVRINRERPWEIRASGPDEDDALSTYCEETFGFRPLDVFRVTVRAGEVDGLVFVRPTKASAWDSTHRLYAHNMFVSEQLRGLVPEWATFVSVCLNTRGLRLTASRESVHHDEALSRAALELGAAIRSRLVRLLRDEPLRFEAIMAIHDTEIRGLAVKDPEFFEIIIDLLEFDTTLDRIRFGEFRREHERLLLTRTTDQFRRIAPIAKAAGLRVFNAGYTYHEELLARASQRHPDLELVAFDAADLVDLLKESETASSCAAKLDRARQVGEDRGFELVVRDFAPEHIPAFFALGLDAEFHRQLDRTKSRASGLWNEVLDAMAPRIEAVAPPRLCLNVQSPLVQRIASLEDAALQRIAVEMLYVQALLSGQYALTGGELSALFDGMGTLLERSARAGDVL